MTQSRPVQLERLIERYRSFEGVTYRSFVRELPVGVVEVACFKVGDDKYVVIQWVRSGTYPKLSVFINKIRPFEPYITTIAVFATLHGIAGVYLDTEGNLTDIPQRRHIMRFEFSDDPSHNLGGTLNHLEYFVRRSLEIYTHFVEPLEMPDRSPSPEPPDARVRQTSPASTIFTREQTRSLTPIERGRLLNVPAEGRASSMASTEPQ